MTFGWRPLARASYWIVVLLVLVLSLAPMPAGGLETSDKVNHFAAFYVLGLGAGLLFPQLRLLMAALLLIGYGGLIEIVQGLSFIGRDRSLLDWLTDIGAVSCAIIPLALSRLRTYASDDKPKV